MLVPFTIDGVPYTAEMDNNNLANIHIHTISSGQVFKKHGSKGDESKKNGYVIKAESDSQLYMAHYVLEGSPNNSHLLILCENNFTLYDTWVSNVDTYDVNNLNNTEPESLKTASSTINNETKSFYYYDNGSSEYHVDDYEPDNFLGVYIPNVFAMINGGNLASKTQTIPVQWRNLEASFEIQVL